MLDGTYQIKLKSPVGPKRGTLVLRVAEGAVNGMLAILGSETPVEGEALGDSLCTLRGAMRTAVGDVRYRLAAAVDGNTLRGMAYTPKGEMPVLGTRVRAARSNEGQVNCGEGS